MIRGPSMANYNCYYFGPYVKVYPPKRTYRDNTRTCINTACKTHGMHVPEGTNFCSVCGNPIREVPVLREGFESLYDFLQDELGDCDLFSIVSMNHKDYRFFVSNRCSKQGGIHIHEHGEYPLQENPDYFDREDWVRLIEKLKEKGFKFEKGIGVIAYYN
jgi:CMP-N-acetylneuraminic acid synthetase